MRDIHSRNAYSRESGLGMSAVVTDSVFLGLNTHYTLTLATGEEVETIQESSIDSIIEKGSTVSLTVKTEKINVFTADGTANLLRGVHNDLEEGSV